MTVFSEILHICAVHAEFEPELVKVAAITSGSRADPRGLVHGLLSKWLHKS